MTSSPAGLTKNPDRLRETDTGSLSRPDLAVCIPARDEEHTLTQVVEAALAATTNAGSWPPRSEVLVVDDGSVDATVAVAEAAGARVISCAATGKGHAMRRAIEATTAEIIVFVDGDLTSLTPDQITALAAPLRQNRCAMLVKPRYRRALYGRADEGGRVTELVARPLLQLFWPELAHIAQPLAGEYAIRRAVLDEIDLADGYAVELALLIDVYERFGLDAIVQVELGERAHRNRPLRDLTPQARSIIEVALGRARQTPSPR
ncbi:MAG: glycosyltransferase [Acidimicrobiales bacterium]